MRVKEAGQIRDGLWLLGTKESCVYLLEGKHACALISAGMSYILPELLRQLTSSGIPPERIEHIIILHSHFDHVGIVPFLKRKWPHLTISASSRGWDVLTNPKAVSVINQYTRKVCERMRGSTDILSSLDWSWRDDVRGESVKQGSCVDLGGRHIEIHETPGHSSCSISAYIPELSVLCPSDAVAIPYEDEYIIAAGSSFADYERSLDHLKLLDIDILCADHYGYIAGEEAKHYIAESASALHQITEKIHRALEEAGSVERAAALLVHRHFECRPDYFVHPDILLNTYTKMLKQFAGSGER